MLRRLSTLLALGCGCIALIWGLLYLHGIFIDEREDALESIKGRRAALDQYARQEIAQRLRDRLAKARPTIEAAVDDPLISAADFWLAESGEQRLPRYAGRSTTTTAARPAYQCLRQRCWLSGAAPWQTESDGPFSERLVMLDQTLSALGNGDREGVEAGVRRILAHRALFVLSAPLDIAFMVALLDDLSSQMRLDPKLIKLVVRDGFMQGSGQIEGLQRALLRHRARFDADGLQFLAGRLAALSEPASVMFADFEARIREAPGQRLDLPTALPAPVLADGGAWYLAPIGNDRVIGVRIKYQALLAEITAAMRARSLLTEAERVRSSPPRASSTLEQLTLEIESPRWAASIEAVHARYQLKALLELIVALLSFGVTALSVLLYRRRHRFLQLKSEFVSAVSHELRTPLASIRLMAETLERRTKDLPAARDYPSRIMRDVDGLSFLVENILSFDRLNRGRWVAKLQRVNLADIIAELEVERDSWERRPTELSSADLEEVVLDADPELLKLLMTNLIRNASVYNQREPARIHISAETNMGWVVRIADNGIGIAETERDRIFDDFYRGADGTGRRERGSGLGLPICRKIVEAHRGTIRVAETSPEGTTFELRFAAASKNDDNTEK